jgi:murein DD-endopeptidase MepM/ murein hydrolase activator NlpD
VEVEPTISNNTPVFPTQSRRITARFGVKGGRHPPQGHEGVDVGALVAGNRGDPIYAAMRGRVTVPGLTSGSDSGSTIITIEGDDGRVYRYFHAVILSGIKKGTLVQTGQQIATMSDEGSEGRIHLHFEVFSTVAAYRSRERGTNRIDPLSLFPDLTFTFY